MTQTFQSKAEIKASIQRFREAIAQLEIAAKQLYHIRDLDKYEDYRDNIEDLQKEIERLELVLENYDTFTGEMMVCIMSGAKKLSNPNVESGWDCIIYGDYKFYVSKKWREKSYKKRGEAKTWEMIFAKCHYKAAEGKGLI